MRLIKYLKNLFVWGSFRKKSTIEIEIENSANRRLHITYREIRELRDRLLPFQHKVNAKTLQQHREHFDALAQDLIDLDVPEEHQRQIVDDLTEANRYFNQLTAKDFAAFEYDKPKRNEALAVLSTVARRLSRTLVALQKELGIS